MKQRTEFFQRQPCLPKHFMKQPFWNVALVLMADPDSQNRSVRKELSPSFVFFGSEMFEPCALEHNPKVAIRERGHA